MSKKSSNVFHDILAKIDAELAHAIQAGGDEVATIRTFTGAIAQAFPHPITLSPNLVLDVRAKFIHRKPFVFFKDPLKVCGKIKMELGDILFIAKYSNKGLVVDHRGSFSQAKIGNKTWHITSHQYEFLSNIGKYPFKFGKTIYSKAGEKELVWNPKKNDPWFSHYLLLSMGCSLALNPKVMKPYYSTNCANFTFDCGRLYIKSNPNSCFSHSFHAFLERFMGQNGVGFTIDGHMEKMVEIIYKAVGLQVDPVEEYQDYFLEDGGGFSLIEFVFTTNDE